MTYKEAIERIHSLDRFGSKPGLDRVRKLFSLIDDDILDQQFIHVTGTNGKGSVCQMLSSVLTTAGYKTGLFISPYIIDFRERIQINNKMISEEELTDAVSLIFPLVEKLSDENIIITEFEFITAVAFYIFKKNRCDITVAEVGLGGRLDSTNLIKNPLVSVITKIDLDHTNVLGDTLLDIAYEKSGIIKENSITVCSYQENEVREYIKDVAKEKKNILLYANECHIDNISYSLDGTDFSYRENILHISLPGVHQIENVKVVLSVFDALKLRNINIEMKDIKKGLPLSKNPARFEIKRKDPLIIIDGAHNPSGMKAFSENVRLYDTKRRKTLIIGMLEDKDVDNSLKYIDGIFDTIITTDINNARAMHCEELMRKCINLAPVVMSINQPEQAINIALKNNNDIYISGSLYLASEIYSVLE